MLCHLFEASNLQGEIQEDSDIGQCFWQKIALIKTPDLMPGFNEVHSLMTNHSQEGIFFEELVVTA